MWYVHITCSYTKLGMVHVFIIAYSLTLCNTEIKPVRHHQLYLVTNVAIISNCKIYWLKFRPWEPHDIISKSRLSVKAPRGLRHQQIKLPQQSSQWQLMLETNKKIIHKVVNGKGDRYTLLNSISH